MVRNHDLVDVGTDVPLSKVGTATVAPKNMAVRHVYEEITPHTLQREEDLEHLQQTAICESSKVPVENTEAQLAWQRGASKLVSQLPIARHHKTLGAI